MNSLVSRFLVLALLLSVSNLQAFAKRKAKAGDKVATLYIGKLEDGRIFDHNVGIKDLVFTIGDSNLLDAFDQAFIGMEEGETKTINIPAKDAYGEFEVSKLFMIKKEELPEYAKEGDTLKYRIGGGYYPVRIIEIGEEEVFIDANHKLAGKDLVFEVTLKDIL